MGLEDWDKNGSRPMTEDQLRQILQLMMAMKNDKNLILNPLFSLGNV